MARWRLLEAHYLKTNDCFWEQEETDRETGRKRRKSFPVPLHLDPKNPADWNYKPQQGHYLTGGSGSEEGQIVVCWEGKGSARDIVMLQDPTPGMEPLDDEAREVTNALAEKWQYNPDAILLSEDNTYANKLINQAADAFEKTTAAQGQMADDMKNMMAAMTNMMGMMTQTLQQNAALLAQLQSGRRI